MNKELYYTPEISEFYTGFEFEYYHTEGKLIKRENLNTEEWKKSIINLDWFIRLSDEYEHPFNNDNVKHLYRVKYLDKEDIESLGFEYTGKSLDIWFEKVGMFNIGSWTSYKILLHYGLSDHRLYVSAVDVGNEATIFEGVVNNKSELIKLIKQLGI